MCAVQTYHVNNKREFTSLLLPKDLGRAFISEGEKCLIQKSSTEFTFGQTEVERL